MSDQDRLKSQMRAEIYLQIATWAETNINPKPRLGLEEFDRGQATAFNLTTSYLRSLARKEMEKCLVR